MTTTQDSALLTSLIAGGGDVSFFILQDNLQYLSLINLKKADALIESSLFCMQEIFTRCQADKLIAMAFGITRIEKLAHLTNLIIKNATNANDYSLFIENLTGNNINEDDISVAIKVYLLCNIEAVINTLPLTRFYREAIDGTDLKTRLSQLISDVFNFNSSINIPG